MPPPYAIRVRTATGWQDIAIQGATGVQGPQGLKGDTGAQGMPGPPLPVGGTTDQVLAKKSNANQDVWWVDAGGGAAAVWIDPSAPTDPEANLWIDTDENPPLSYHMPPLVTVLPTAPFDGQEVRYQDAAMATDGVVWALRYRAASLSAYKWEYVGGQPLLGANDAIGTSTQGTFGNCAGETDQPRVTLPLVGDYLLEYGAGVHNAAAGQESWMTVLLPGTAAADAEVVMYSNIGTTAKHIAVMRAIRRNGVAAGMLTARYRVGGGTGSWRDRWIKATPIRVSS